jgi:predicted HTH domain antitoxin
MELIINDEQLRHSGLNEQQLRLELAIFLFQKDIFSLGKAAEFCGLHKMQMQMELGKREIPLHYTEEMFRQEIETLNKMRNDRS